MLKNKLNELLMDGNWRGVRTLVDAMFMFDLVPWYNEDGMVEEVTRSGRGSVVYKTQKR